MNEWPRPAPGLVYVWLLPLDVDSSRQTGWRSWLSDEELRRAMAFHFKRDRARFVAGRAQLRVLLGAATGRAPGEVSFRGGRWGKPSVVGTADDTTSAVQFTFSRSEGLALCAVTLDAEIGVDIECTVSRADLLGLADRYFAPAERARLYGLPGHRQGLAFYRCWTSKEAYLKALGIGLSQSLSCFAVEADPDRPPAVLQTAPGDATRAWSLIDLPVGPGAVATLAVPAAGCVVRVGRVAFGGGDMHPDRGRPEVWVGTW